LRASKVILLLPKVILLPPGPRGDPESPKRVVLEAELARRGRVLSARGEVGKGAERKVKNHFVDHSYHCVPLSLSYFSLLRMASQVAACHAEPDDGAAAAAAAAAGARAAARGSARPPGYCRWSCVVASQGQRCPEHRQAQLPWPLGAGRSEVPARMRGPGAQAQCHDLCFQRTIAPLLPAL
jgi:hypothetical protein